MSIAPALNKSVDEMFDKNSSAVLGGVESKDLRGLFVQSLQTTAALNSSLFDKTTKNYVSASYWENAQLAKAWTVNMCSFLDGFIEPMKRRAPVQISSFNSVLWSLNDVLISDEDCENKEEKLFYKIAEVYKPHEQVKSIHVERHEHELFVLVLLSIEEYDYDLMGRLIDVEYNLRKIFPLEMFTFFYPPVGNRHVAEEQINLTSRCVFAR
ncbi:MAG: hypothetical protein V1882_11425 [Candidatus Omnitrophota bacterium]